MTTEVENNLDIGQRIDFLKFADDLYRRKPNNIFTPRCRRCTLNAHAVRITPSGVCELCEIAETQAKQEALPSEKLCQEIDQFFTDHSGVGNNSFDALLMYSGGKDSTYLLHQLRQRYPRLRLFAVMIDNLFSSSVALNNARFALEKYRVEFEIIRPPFPLVQRLFRHCFLHYGVRGGYLTVDRADGELIFDIARNVATRKKIPLILAGISPVQCEDILKVKHFVLPEEHMEFDRDQVAGFPLSDIYSHPDQSYWWFRSRHKNMPLPQIVTPFFAWGYHEEQVAEEGARYLSQSKWKSHPLITNHQLLFVTFALDYLRFGYSTFEIEFAKSIRRGQASRLGWLKIFQAIEYSVPRGEFFSELIERTLSCLNLTGDELGIPRVSKEKRTGYDFPSFSSSI